MAESVLHLHDITRAYKQGEGELRVLNGVNLTIPRGKIVAMVGPSGSGKTTLLQIAGMLDTPTSGEVMLNGEVLTRASESVRTAARGKHIGFVYQFHHLLPEFSAQENVMLPQMSAGVSRGKAMERADQLLGRLGLKARLHHRPAELSGGEQQRVAIARAMANAPKLLLADEPTGNLDPATAADVFAILMASVREQGLSALIATHNMELAARMDTAYRMENGRLTQVVW